MVLEDYPSTSLVRRTPAEALRPLLTGDGVPLKPEVAVPRLFAAHCPLLVVRDSGQAYWQTASSVYQPLPEDILSDWIRDLWEVIYGDGWSERQLSATIKKVVKGIKEKLPKIDKRYIMVAKNLYWDSENATLVEQPEGRVFYRLFDAIDPKDAVNLTPEQVAVVKERQQATFEELVATSTLTERYDFITTWACGSHDLYMDMIRGHAYCFLAKRPPGAYFLVGPKRNGKSTYVKLIVKIMGSPNSARLNLLQLNDPSCNMILASALINAPDEIGHSYDKKTQSEFERNFKIITQHEPIVVKKYYSQDPAIIPTDFLCFFPANHLPNWSSSDIGPCMERSYIIPFYAKLNASDLKTKDFFKETFTPDLLADYLGTLLGVAAYYHAKGEFEFSPTMQRQQRLVLESGASATAYVEMWKLFFDGFQNKDIIYEDYCYWCDARSLKRQSRPEFELAINDYLVAKRSKAPLEYGTGRWHDDKRKNRPNVLRIPRPNKLLMVEDYDYGHHWGTLRNMHDELRRESLVDKLDNFHKEVEGENYMEKILAADLNATPMAPTQPEPEQPALIDTIFPKE